MNLVKMSCFSLFAVSIIACLWFLFFKGNGKGTGRVTYVTSCTAVQSLANPELTAAQNGGFSRSQEPSGSGREQPDPNSADGAPNREGGGPCKQPGAPAGGKANRG